MNILYLTWGEVITRDGIFDNQVVEQLKYFKRVAPAANVWSISGIPIINRYFFHYRADFFQEVEQIRRSFAEANVHFGIRWIPVVARWFHSQFYHFPFYSVGQHKFLKNFTQQNGIEIVHCRGYHATRLALLVREHYKLTYKVIFDTRGLFPEEGLLAGHYHSESLSFKAWKNLEKWLVDSSDAVVNVSETFTEYIQSLTDNPNIYTIYTSTNLEIFKKADFGKKRCIRDQLQVNDRQKVLVYSGGIDTKGWHRLSNLISVFKVFKEAFAEAILLIVTRSSHRMIQDELKKLDFLKNSYLLVAANSPTEVSDYLQAGDYSAFAYYNVVNEIERRVSYTVVGSKTGEYFAVGLPVIVNQAVGAAAKLVGDYGIGCTYEVGNEAAIVSSLRKLDTKYDAVSKKCTEVARKYFDARNNAEKYFEVYQQILPF
jgi:glycosyltransferase involved in cell wall biosynthesis